MASPAADFTYGKRRIHRELVKSDVKIGLAKVSRLIKAIEIPVKYPKKRHRYNEVGEESIYAPNILKRQFTPETHNIHWVTDVTYIRSHQGWSYLACVLDLATKEVVGYSLSRSPDTNLTLAALDNVNHQSIVMEVESYIRFYNYKRSHSGIDYLTPNEKYQQMQKVA